MSAPSQVNKGADPDLLRDMHESMLRIRLFEEAITEAAIEEGIFHESLNFAALNKLPVLFICENNLYASHLKLEVRQPQPDLYKHAAPYAVPGIRIDGNDIMSVYETAQEAVRRARAHEGPTLLECMTYRWRGHVGPSYDFEYNIRTREEVEHWMTKDPIQRYVDLLAASGVMDESAKKKIDEGIRREVDDALKFARESPFPAVEDLLEHVYKN